LDGQDESDHKHERVASSLKHALTRARRSILWERLWPILAGMTTVAGLFLALSWAGLWLALPPVGRAVGLAIFALILAVATAPLLMMRWPTVNDGLQRLDRNSGARHRPATTVADEIAANGRDPVAQALWRAHVERALSSARHLKAGWPSPRLALRDPMAFRALVVFLVVAAFFAASGERFKRVAAAFDWHGVVAPANFRVDVWINPPVYTGRAPSMLPGLKPGEVAKAETAPVAVPAGSQLIVRSTGKVKLEVTHKGGVDVAKDEAAPVPAQADTEEFRFVINGSGSVTVRGAGANELAWSFDAIPDKPPAIKLLREPEREARGSLRLDYRVEDDYGVVSARAEFTRKPGRGSANAHPLFDPPKLTLALPQARVRAGNGQTIHDLSEHPWAGSEVDMTLVARDEAGNEGRSAPHEFTLPQRTFFKPLARALVEQRRILALDANEKPIVLTALDALTLAPDKFSPDLGVYLGLRSLYFALENATTDDELRAVAARMWSMALQIEDGNMSAAEQALRAAQDALRQALERGASDQEIKKLTDQLRAALDKFLQSLAEQMRKNPRRLSRPLDRNQQMLSSQDLKNMIDRMENLARSGDRDAARQLLEQLQSMLENLQMAQPNGDDMGDQDDMMSSLDELNDMIRKQQQLRDRTYKRGQDERRDRQRGQQQDQQQGQNGMEGLRQDQQALRDRLNRLLEQLRRRNLGDPQGKGQDSEQQLGQAGKEMGDAESELGEGNSDNAVESQGRALEAMRKGAQGMAQAMRQNEIGPGQGAPGGRGRARAQRNTDPLGRPLRGREYGDDVTVKVPGEIDAQRARRVLEELRRRYADPNRPQLELDYIERLLKGF
jgi:uncharacterized protein (TIGR02302 family)